MGYKKLITVFITFLGGVSLPGVKAQDLNITGDTVFVNREAEIQIQFPSVPNGFNTDPKNAPYNLRSERTSLIIVGTLENSRQATLRVSEGGRTHHFFLIFKKEIDYNDTKALFKDYSTTEKLKIRIAELKAIKAANDQKPVVVTNPSHGSPGTGNTVPPDDDKKYVTIIDAAKIYLDKKQYPQAKEAYKQALKLRPGDLYATHQLEIISKLESPGTRPDPQQPSKDLYLSYIAQGEKAYANNQLSEARAFFEEALTIKANDAIATSYIRIIEEKERKKKNADELESNYNASIQLANTLYEAGDLEGAKVEYTKAIGFIKKQLPIDQIKLIDKKLADQAASERIRKQEQARQQKLENEKREAQEREDNYATAIRVADSSFKAKDYDNAKIEYNKALDFIRRDWPAKQINEIDKIKKEIARQEDDKKRQEELKDLEHRYDAAMEAAGQFFQNGDYANAKIMYNRAMSLIPRQLPQDKIKEINKILDAKAKEAAAEKLRIETEKAINERYEIIEKNADAEFDKKNYAKAKTLYTQALALKSSEPHPKARIDLIVSIFAENAAAEKARNDSIIEAREIDRKYKAAVSKGKSSFQKNDLLNAKVFYSDAADLKPSEEEPKKQLDIIIKKLEDIARETELNNKYSYNITLGDSLRIAKLYEAAINSYNEALKLKPLESYPKVRIKNLQFQIDEEEKRKAFIKQQEIEKDFRDHVTLADKAVADRRYEDARAAYTYALKIHPDNEYALQRNSRIVYQLEKKAREDSIAQAALKKDIAPVKKKSKRKKSAAKEAEKVAAKEAEKVVAAREPEKAPAREPQKLIANASSLQAKPIPYSPEELKRKYPGIDFLAPLPEQPFNKSTTSPKMNLSFYDSLASQKPRLNLTSGGQGIKLIVEGITFEAATAFLKVRILNNSNSDFLTGAMMLTWTKQTGNHIKLYPYHLFPSPLPVIKTGYEMIMIYACKTYNILDQDTLTFELSDRPKIIKLEVTIPGSVYNSESIRPE